MSATTLHQYAEHLLAQSVAALTVAPGVDNCIPDGWSPPARQTVAWAEPVDWPCDYLAVWWTAFGYWNGGDTVIGDSRNCGPIPYARFCVRLKRCKDDVIDGTEIPSAAQITDQSREQSTDTWLLVNGLFANRDAGTLLPPGVLAPFQKDAAIVFEPATPQAQAGMVQGVDVCIRVPVFPLACP